MSPPGRTGRAGKGRAREGAGPRRGRGGRGGGGRSGRRGRSGPTLGRIGWLVLCSALAVACGVAGASTLRAWRAAQRPPPPARGNIQLEVLNGCGRPGVAERATRTLVGLGFDVVRSGNADRFDHDHTVVIDRSGHGDKAREVSAALGCGGPERDLRPESFLDATVIIGRDFESLPGFAPPAERKSGR